MSELKRVAPELLLVVVTVLVSIAFVANALHLSGFCGRLALPPQFDDVVYLLSGFELFETSLSSPLGSVLTALFDQHAPFQSFLAFAGYRLFGVSHWSAYQANGIPLVAFMLGVLWMTRSIDVVSRLSIVVIVLATPFTTNLVTEFRPDLFWGLLCGFAILLLLHPGLLDHPGKIRMGAVALGVAALHAKPSAAPATALLLATAVVAAVGIRMIYRPLSPRETAIRLAVPLAIALVILAPFFLANARRIYEYIHLALIAWHDVNHFKGSLLDHAFFHSFGLTYRTALFTTLWIGIAAFIIEGVRLRRSSLDQDLAYHLALVGVVILAYLIPTISGVKSYFLGGIFYGTFIVAAIGSLVSTVRASNEHRNGVGYAARWALPVIACLTLLTAPGLPLVDVWDRQLAVESNAVYQQMMSAIARDSSQRDLTDAVKPLPRPSPQPVHVYTPSPFVMNGHAISLIARWEGKRIVGTEGYYTRTIPEQQANLAKSNYVILSEVHDTRYPGSTLSPQLLELVEADPRFETISVFRHANGLRTFLFRNRRAEPPG